MGTYITLVDDLIAACENDGDEFLAYVPNMVDRAEERLVKDLDDYGLVSYNSATFTINTNTVTLPTDTRVIKNVNIVADGSKINLLMRTDEFISDYWPVSASVGTPKYYGRKDNTNIVFAPTATSTFTGEIVAIIKPDTLTSLAPTNYFTDFCYDLLWNACMVEAMMFQKDYPTMAIFQNTYTQLLDLQRNQARRTRRDDMQAPANPLGGDNTLVPQSQ